MTEKPTKPDTPERWQEALTRALYDGVRVYQSPYTGEWVATSGSLIGRFYHLEVYPSRRSKPVITCDCPAAEHEDPVCKHRARWYFDHNYLDLDVWAVPEKMMDVIQGVLHER